MDLLKDAVNRTYTERFLFTTRLYKIQQTLSRAKIPISFTFYQLIDNKKAVNRFKDEVDVIELGKIKASPGNGA